MHFYKPNPRSTGTACSFQVTSSGKSHGIYGEFVKQTGWNDSKKLGSFKGGTKVNVKFNETEAAAMIDAIERNVESKFFHSFDGGSTTINFSPYINKTTGVQMGFSLSVKKGQDSFLMGFTHGETVQLREWLKFAINRIFVSDHNEHKKAIEASRERNA